MNTCDDAFKELSKRMPNSRDTDAYNGALIEIAHQLKRIANHFEKQDKHAEEINKNIIDAIKKDIEKMQKEDLSESQHDGI